MSRNAFISPALYDYVLTNTSREPEVLRQLRDETARLFPDKANMQIGVDQGQFMGLLARAINAKKTLEVGVFTGYSSTAVALALPGDARLFCCDISDEWTSVARRYWREAGVEYKMALKLGPALDSLQHLLASGQEGTFDFAFIDADKPNYDAYYEACLKLLRKNGLLLIDNTLWSGRVADTAVNDDDTRAIRALNEKIGKDPRVEQSLLTIGDGLTIAIKL